MLGRRRAARPRAPAARPAAAGGQKSTGPRMRGQVMQWPPPRPRPSSAPTMVMTSTRALRRRVFVCGCGRHAGDHDMLCRAVLEQRCRDLCDRLPGRTFAHAHQDDTIADRHDVAALERRLPPAEFRITPPHGGAGEVMGGTRRRPSSAASRRDGPATTAGSASPPRTANSSCHGCRGVGQRRHEVFPDARRLTDEGDVGGRNSSGRSDVARPPIRYSASRRGSSVSRKARVPSISPMPTSFAVILRSRSHDLASGTVIVSARRSSPPLRRSGHDGRTPVYGDRQSIAYMPN